MHIKHSILASLISISSLGLFSCSSDESEIYSCDKAIDQWVKSHTASICKMSRAQWLNIDQGKKLPVYRAFSPEQRIQFWENKFMELESLPWTKDEEIHIQKLVSFFRSHKELMYAPPTDNQLDEVDEFFYGWQKYAIDSLGWTKQLCIAIAGSGEKVKNKEGETSMDRSVMLSSKTRSANMEGTCNCNRTYDFCVGITPCTNVSCEGTSWGCGWLLVASCNGRCGGI